MAIEAKTQITIDRYAPRAIKNYILKDVIFSKILEILEPPKSIKIFLSLYYQDDLIDRCATAWESFRVSSISYNGVTNEHCYGRIMVEIDSPSDELDAAQDGGNMSAKDLES